MKRSVTARSDISMWPRLSIKGGPIPLFSDTFDTKYRAENFTDTDSDTDTNLCSYTVACISHQMSYLPLGI